MDEHSIKTVLRWWQSMNLSTSELKEKNIQPAPSAHKAQIKRSESVLSVMLTEGFRALWLNLDDEIILSKSSHHIECWATIASVLVFVKTNNEKKLGQAAGAKSDADKSIVSELRFSQLQSAKSPEDLMRRLRRIIQQLKGELSIVQLVKDIHKWFSEHYQLRPHKTSHSIKFNWAMDYYRAAVAKEA